MSKPSEKDKKKQVTSNTELLKKIDELTADLQRVHADFVNYRRRSEEEKQEIFSFAKREVVSQLLPILDNLERALAHVPKNVEKDPLAQGFKMIGVELKALLQQKFGVEEIPALNEKFDPRWHEAVEAEAEDAEIVTTVLKKGYKMGEEVLRPSLVKVGREKV